MQSRGRVHTSVVVQITVVAVVLVGGLTGVTAASSNAAETSSSQSVGEKLDVSFDVPGEATAGEPVAIDGVFAVPDGGFRDVVGGAGPDATAEVAILVDGEEVVSETRSLSDDGSSAISTTFVPGESGTVDVELRATVEVETRLGTKSIEGGSSTTVDVADTAPDLPFEERTLEGAALSIPDIVDVGADDAFDEYGDLLAAAGLDGFGDDPFVLATEDSLYLVVAGGAPKDGPVTVEGVVANETIERERTTFGLVAARSVTADGSPTETTVDSVSADPERYDRDLVRLTGTHRTSAVLTDPLDAGLSYPTRTGVLTTDPATPGSAVGAIVDDGGALVDDPKGAVASMADSGGSASLPTVAFENGFWANGEATVDALVLAAGTPAREFVNLADDESVLAGGSRDPALYLVSDAFEAERSVDPGTVAADPAAYDGRVVTVESSLTQASISLRNSLPNCGVYAGEVQVPSVGCVPAIHDVVVHAGAAWDGLPEGRDDVLPVVAVSATDQDGAVEYDDGSYRITGEVVSTDRIDDSLPDGVVLLAADMERTGGTAAEADVASDLAAALGDALASIVLGSDGDETDEPPELEDAESDFGGDDEADEDGQASDDDPSGEAPSGNTTETDGADDGSDDQSSDGPSSDETDLEEVPGFTALTAVLAGFVLVVVARATGSD